MDDKPATVVGSVTDDHDPVSQPHVVLVQWPPIGLDLFSSLLTVTGDEDGRFVFAGLAPGDYRLLAVSSDAKRKLERPNVLERLLVNAQKLSLGERQIQNVNLRLVAP